MYSRCNVFAVILGALTSCTTVPPAAAPVQFDGRPLDSLPAGADLSLVRQDLIASASERFGSHALYDARATSTYLIAKRFAGMAPPPPPGAAPNWMPPTPTVLLIKRPEGWMVASRSGWRRAKPEAAIELDRMLADRKFWIERPRILACPDYGATLLLLKMQGKAETVRKSTCPDIAEKIALAALNG